MRGRGAGSVVQCSRRSTPGPPGWRCAARAGGNLAASARPGGAMNLRAFAVALRVASPRVTKTDPEHAASPTDDTACFGGTSRSKLACARRTRCVPVVGPARGAGLSTVRRQVARTKPGPARRGRGMTTGGLSVEALVAGCRPRRHV
jgi:hypothetical protein